MDEDTPVSEDAGFGIGAVSRRLGIPAPTLRTWNLRYGLGPSRRSPGGHRRYGAADVRRLAEMKRLIATGLVPAEAARLALALPDTPAAPPSGARTTPVPSGGLRTPQPPGGRPARLQVVAALARAAIMLDGRAVAALVEETLAAQGVVWTWEHLFLPALDAVCRGQDATGSGIDAEHLLSGHLQAALHRLAGDVPPQSDRPDRPDRPVVLACAEEEQHSLPVHALAAALAERGVQTRVLGARTPYAALAHAMRRLGPAAVFVWSQRAETGDTAPLAALPEVRPACRIVIGGRGWQGRAPAGVVRVSTLPDAVACVMSTLI
ncbi:MerR family transcriptional regulator [Nonomuraea sp. NPDC049637]|uniref:MerR family transcriptional regulator n=1 Tax=Nonomuraea sp. NPDC049637 TaxID=3154356 RepID=UPI00342C9729